MDQAIVELLLRGHNVAEQYRWLYGALYGTVVGERTRRSGPADLTGAAAGVPKGSLTQAYARMLDAHSKLTEAESVLIKGLNVLDPPQTPEPWMPKSVNRADLATYHEAQERRVDRGETTPL
jgi:hypothetical protein